MNICVDFMNIRKDWKYKKGRKMVFFGDEGVGKTSCFRKTINISVGNIGFNPMHACRFRS